MGDSHGQGIIVQLPPALFYYVGDGHQPRILIFAALCLANSVKSHVSSQISNSEFSIGDFSVVRADGIPLKRRRGKRETRAALDSEASAQQGDGEGTVGSIIPGLDNETASRCIAFASRSTYGSLSMTHRNLRELIRSGYIFELRRRLGIVEQWVYMFASGDSSWKAFDPKRCSWMNLPPCNTDYAFSYSDKESLSAGTDLLWMGIEVTNYIIFRYELTTNTWSRGPSMNHPRCLFASASCGEYAFVAGGNRGGVVLKSAERYNSVQRRWELLPDMNIARQKSSGCFMDGKFYVIGGRDESHRRVTSGEEYDPQTRRWRVIPNMFPVPAGREVIESSPPLVAVVQNNLYCVDSSINVLKAYNKESNSWGILGPVPVRADFQNGWGLAFKALGDALYMIGGYRRISRMGEGLAMFSWRPGGGEETPMWNMVTAIFAGTGSFLCNCAVMAC